MNHKILFSERVVTDDGVIPASLVLEKGKIVSILKDRMPLPGYQFMDYANRVIMPGIIDCHVHINEPGRTSWEGFDTATRAAAAGGVTTLIDMPLNSNPVTTGVAQLNQKITSARNNIHVNCGFWGGLVPTNLNEVEDLLKAGVFGIKAFLIHSGIDEFPNVVPSDLDAVLPILKKYNRPLLVHCELDLNHDAQLIEGQTTDNYETYMRSRPDKWEIDAIDLLISKCQLHQARGHIVHLATDQALDSIIRAKSEGIQITVETCPHYLFFHSEKIAPGNTQFKCAPPIRSLKNNENLWKALVRQDIDFVASDHSPSPPELKLLEEGDFFNAWGGIAGLQFSLSAIWTMWKNDHLLESIGLNQLSFQMSGRVAQFLGLSHRKGFIRSGYDADLVVWDPEKEKTISASS